MFHFMLRPPSFLGSPFVIVYFLNTEKTYKLLLVCFLMLISYGGVLFDISYMNSTYLVRSNNNRIRAIHEYNDVDD